MKSFNKTLLESLDTLDSYAIVNEYEELETNSYKDFKHVNDVWDHLEASKSEDDLKDRISDIDPSKYGSVYYDLHKDKNGATVIIEYNGEDEEYYEKVDVYFNEDLEEDETASSDDDIKVFMNTWANYNEYGADEGITPTGWMTPEEAIEYAKKYADKEPFINDTDNCPWEVSEYCDLGTELPNMESYNNFDDRTLLKNLIELGGYGDDISAYIDVAERGDYIWFEGVDDDEDLGRAYVDMVGGLEGIGNKADYFDASSYKDDIEGDMRYSYADSEGIDVDDIDEDDFETYLDSYVDEVANNWTGEDDSYFDYAKMGRELTMDGFAYTSDGAIQILK